MSDIKEQLQELAELREQGLITPEDYEREKQAVLAARRSRTGPPPPDPSSANVPRTRESNPNAPSQIGSYTILGEIGQGGMGVVYRGRHRSETFAARQGGDVAIKVLHAQFAARPDIVERFEREAEMGIKLEHPGIVRAFELIIDSGQVALVMELVAGQPMDTLIGNVTGPIPWGRAQPLFQQLLDAVGHAHIHGVVHRDLKPENIIVGPDGALKVLDFGIAKDLSSDKTKTGTGMGTVDYMAPEQYLDASSVDQRADIYALGMTLYEMVAGRLPWDASSTEFGILEMKKKGDLPPPTDFYPDIPPQVVAAIAQATAIRIADRFGSTADFADALSQPVKQSRSAPPSAVGSGTVIEAEAPEVTADEATDPPAATPPVPAPSPPIPSPSSPQPLPTVSGRGAGKGFLAFGSLAFGILAVVGAGAFYMLDEVDNSSSRSSKKDRDDDEGKEVRDEAGALKGTGSHEKGDTIPGDGAETEANVSTAGRCSEHTEPPVGVGLGLTQDTAMTALTGTWHVGRTAFQEQCLHALQLALRGDWEAVSRLEGGDLKEWATLVAELNAEAGEDGTSQGLREAQEVFDKLQNRPDLTLTMGEGTVQLAGDQTFSGTLSVVSGEGDKFTVTMSADSDQTTDIYFASSTKIYVTQGSNSTKGTTFDKIP